MGISSRRNLALAFLSGSSVISSLLMLAAIPLRSLRVLAGSTLYWIIGLLLSVGLGLTGFWALGLVLLMQMLMVGVYSEFEERGASLFVAGFGAILITTLMVAAGFAFWVSIHSGDSNWYLNLLSLVESELSSVLEKVQKSPLSAKDLIVSAPSLLICTLSLGLFLGLYFERRILLACGRLTMRSKYLSHFSVHDSFIWVFIAGLSGYFLSAKGSWIHIIGSNLLNVAIFGFVYQGMAVLSAFFLLSRMPQLWRKVWIVVLVTHLTPLLAVVGLADYWMDFRLRMAKRAEEIEKEIYKK